MEQNKKELIFEQIEKSMRLFQHSRKNFSQEDITNH